MRRFPSCKNPSLTKSRLPQAERSWAWTLNSSKTVRTSSSNHTASSLGVVAGAAVPRSMAAITRRGVVLPCWIRRGRRHELRAMYTHPEHVRKGVGRTILGLCEAAARREGFKRVELMATMAGEPLYLACGYEPIERVADDRGGTVVPLLRMGKSL